MFDTLNDTEIDFINDIGLCNYADDTFERLETIVSRSPDIQDIMETGMKKKNGKYLVFCKDQEDLKEKMEQAQSIFGKVNPKIIKF